MPNDDTIILDEGENSGQNSPAAWRRPGDIIDGAYQVILVLGTGGMGTVYACLHTGLNKEYALKMLSGHGVTAEAWTRFQKEAKVLARLNHPNIVAIHNMGIDQGQSPYYVMDRLAPESLADTIRARGPLSKRMALALFMPVANALGSAHGQNIVHRDIKPSNLMVVRNSRGEISQLKLVDFGIARWSKQALEAQSQTATGITVGTPYYMSPEQCQGTTVDARSDIYSLGCALFETLTGQPPFLGENAFQTFMMHQNDMPPRLAEVAGKPFPQALEMAIEKMLRKDPARRYQSTAEVEADLGLVLESLIQTAPQNKFQKTKPDFIPDDKTETPAANSGGRKTALLAVATLVVASVIGGLVIAFNSQTRNAPAVEIAQEKAIEEKNEEVFNKTPNPNDVSSGYKQRLQSLGCSPAECKQLSRYNPIIASKDQSTCTRDFKHFRYLALANHRGFLNSEKTAWNFPEEGIIGAFSINGATPQSVLGKMPYKKGRYIFYQNYCLHDVEHFVDLFKPGDLTGIELTLTKTEPALRQIKSWSNLEHLSFFNSLTRAFPGYYQYDESLVRPADLAVTNDLPKLTSLGLCGLDTSGEDIVKLPVLKRLKSLRLKHISRPGDLIKRLPEFKNIQELWLIDLPLSPADLEPLTTMTNLQSLKVSRCGTDRAKADVYARMPHLKHLQLDDFYNTADRHRLKARIADSTFTCPVDATYWQTVKSHPLDTLFPEEFSF